MIPCALRSVAIENFGRGAVDYHCPEKRILDCPDRIYHPDGNADRLQVQTSFSADPGIHLRKHDPCFRVAWHSQPTNKISRAENAYYLLCFVHNCAFLAMQFVIRLLFILWTRSEIYNLLLSNDLLTSDW